MAAQKAPRGVEKKRKSKKRKSRTEGALTPFFLALEKLIV